MRRELVGRSTARGKVLGPAATLTPALSLKGEGGRGRPGEGLASSAKDSQERVKSGRAFEDEGRFAKDSDEVKVL